MNSDRTVIASDLRFSPLESRHRGTSFSFFKKSNPTGLPWFTFSDIFSEPAVLKISIATHFFKYRRLFYRRLWVLLVAAPNLQLPWFWRCRQSPRTYLSAEFEVWESQNYMIHRFSGTLNNVAMFILL